MFKTSLTMCSLAWVLALNWASAHVEVARMQMPPSGPGLQQSFVFPNKLCSVFVTALATCTLSRRSAACGRGTRHSEGFPRFLPSASSAALHTAFQLGSLASSLAARTAALRCTHKALHPPRTRFNQSSSACGSNHATLPTPASNH